MIKLLRENPDLTIKQVAWKFRVSRIELRDAQLKITKKIKPLKNKKK